MSVGAYAALAHGAIDELVERHGSAVVCGGTGLYLRAALADLEVPPRAGRGVRDRIRREVEHDPGAAHVRLRELDPRAAAVIHPNESEALVRALELAEAGESLVPEDDRLWTGAHPAPDTDRGDRRARGGARRRIVARTDAMFDQGVVEEVREALRGECRGPRRRPSGCTRSRRFPRQRRASGSSSVPAGTPPTSGSGCGGSRASLAWTAAPEARRRWRMQFSKWHALGNSYLVAEQPQAGPLTPNRVQRLCSASVGIGSDGLVEVTGREGATAVVKIWNPDGSTAEMSGNGVRIAARWLAAETGATHVTIETAGRRIAARMLNALDTETDVGEFDVGAAEMLDGVELTPVSVGNPHAVIRLHDPTRDDLLRLGPFRRDTLPVPRSHQRPARPGRRTPRLDRARLGAWRRGDDRLRLVVGRSGCGGRRTRVVRPHGHGASPWWGPARGNRGRPGIAHGARRTRRLGLHDPVIRGIPAPLDRLGSDAPERPRAS